jgi:hypothetical protein
MEATNCSKIARGMGSCTIVAAGLSMVGTVPFYPTPYNHLLTVTMFAYQIRVKTLPRLRLQLGSEMVACACRRSGESGLVLLARLQTGPAVMASSSLSVE